jgi:hypothetical protein
VIVWTLKTAAGLPTLSCRLVCAALCGRGGGVLVSVGLTCLRTKFRRNPRQELDWRGCLVDRPLLAGKLTAEASVDTCPVAALQVWAVVCAWCVWLGAIGAGCQRAVCHII